MGTIFRTIETDFERLIAPLKADVEAVKNKVETKVETVSKEAYDALEARVKAIEAYFEQGAAAAPVQTSAETAPIQASNPTGATEGTQQQTS